MSLQDRTYTPPVIDPSGKGREEEDSPSAEEPSQIRPSVSSENEKLAERDLKASDIAAQEEEESYGFAHPAASRPQRIVWIPKDTLGLAEEEERACKEAGVKVSHINAEMNETGKVGIDGGPPDMI